MSKHSANVSAHARASGHNHVTSRQVSNSAGFGTGAKPANTGADSATGLKAGAPYHSRTQVDDTVERTQSGLRDNPTNPHDTNETGVLGNIIAATSPTLDSPVPKGTPMPDRFGNYKADAVASVTTATPVGQPVTFPSSGVIGRS